MSLWPLNLSVTVSRSAIRQLAPADPAQERRTVALVPDALAFPDDAYREAARSLHTREATIAPRVHRGRRHLARELLGEPEREPEPSA